MLEWLRFFGEFLLSSIKSIGAVIPMFARAVTLINTSMVLAPPFLGSIMTLMLVIIIVMWVVNIF